MTLVTLSDVLQPALKGGYAVAGLVTLGWEDMRAFVAAAEAEDVPVILQAGPGCRAHTPLPVLGAMFRNLAEGASVPVVAHLDHGQRFDECQEALDAGFSSLMFDGSRLPLAENIAETRRVVELAHRAGLSCEGEIGFVGYAEGEASAGTDPQEAGRFARETEVDAMAVSVGNVHLQTETGGRLELFGVSDLSTTPDGVIDGSFEAGDLRGWSTVGDVRVLDKLGFTTTDTRTIRGERQQFWTLDRSV